MGDIVTIPRGNVDKGIDVGAIVRVNGRPRLVTNLGKYTIAFVRFGSSWCWKPRRRIVPGGTPGGRNATAFHDLPMTVEVIHAASLETTALANRFSNWSKQPVTREDWDLACAIGVATIKCRC